MLLRRLPSARPLTHILRTSARTSGIQQLRHASGAQYEPTPVAEGLDDPNMNGGYVNPIPRKRALRDPYAGWWDPQERRNFGEPVHEDNDTLGVFSTEPYTHSPPGRAALHLGIFVSAVLGLCAVVAQFYPDRPSVPREFPDGLEAEMGGPRALIARKNAEEELASE